MADSLTEAGELLHPALLGFLNAPSDARPVVHVAAWPATAETPDRGRWTVGAVWYDPDTQEVVIRIGEPMPPVGEPLSPNFEKEVGDV